MTTLAALQTLITRGESTTLERKRSNGELREAMQTLRAFANGKGGRVVLGVKPGGDAVGQQVSEQTFHEIAAQRERFEPPIEFEVESVKLASGRSALVLTVAGGRDSVPFTFDGRAFERVGNTTRKMGQERYEALLLERGHSRRRRESKEADELTLKDLDRVEVWSPNGITPDSLKAAHLSVQRNPIIADVFHRTGLIEKWGRGTNRVAQSCTTSGIAPPEFEEITGAAVVTFRVPVAASAGSTGEVPGEVTEEVTGEVARLLGALLGEPVTRKGLQAALGLRHEEHFRQTYLVPALVQGLVEMTIPDKPNSRLQKYRLTPAGRAVVARRTGG